MKTPPSVTNVSPSASASAARRALPNVFYKYRTPDGRIAIVDSLEQVPASERGNAERVELEAGEAPSRYPLVSEVAAHMDWPSFATGFGVALALAAVLSLFGRGSARVLGFMVVAAILVAGTGAYFGLLRKTTGQSDATFATPGAIIDDAKRTVTEANKRQREREQLIEQMQRDAK